MLKDRGLKRRRDEDEDDDDDLVFIEKGIRSPKWQVHIVQSVVRMILNILAGGLIAKGYGSQERWDQVIAVSVILATLVWAVIHQRSKDSKVVIIKPKSKDPNESYPEI